MNPTLAAHAAAILTILIWGATFTSTKVLLQAFSPFDILFLRFLLGACALLLPCPRTLGHVFNPLSACYCLRRGPQLDESAEPGESGSKKKKKIAKNLE